MKTTLEGVRIAGIANAVPSTLRTVGETASAAGISQGEAAKIAKMSGVQKRHVAPAAQVVISLDEFGNTSCASIPLAIGHRLSAQLTSGSANLLMAGFGVGWSWGALAVSCGPMVLPRFFNSHAESA